MLIWLAMVVAAAIMFDIINTDVFRMGVLVGVAMLVIAVKFDYQQFEDERHGAHMWEENGIYSMPYLMMAVIIWFGMLFATSIMFDSITMGILCIEVFIGVAMFVVAAKFDYQQYQDERDGARRREKLGTN